MSDRTPRSSRAGDPLGPAIARFLDGDGSAVGAGLLLGRQIVATTATVLGRSDRLRCDFPLLETSGGTTEPAGEAELAGTADLAGTAGLAGTASTGPVLLVRLAEPAPGAARVPSLHRGDGLAGRRVRALGFPDDMQDGVWTVGVLSDAGESGGTLTLRTDPAEPPVEAGFAGAAVWDDSTGAVLGLLDVADDGSTAVVVPIAEALGADALPNPYRGLEVFEEEHAEFFCGRDADIARLTAMLERRDLVAVTGRSGSGKSSLLRAGLVPWLRRHGAEPLPVRADPETVRSTLAGLDPRRDVVLLLDQFEELVEADQDAARRMLALLSTSVGPTVAGGRVRACLTLRWDAWDELLTRDSAELLTAGTVPVAPLARSRLREAIETPAARAPGPDFAAGLVDRILDDAGDEPGALPLVETLLTQLWERHDGGQLTVEAYDAIGGVEGAIAAYAEHAVAHRTAERELPVVRRLLTSMARLGDDDRFVRRPLPLAGLDAERRRVLDRLVAGRLAVLGRDATDAPVAELAHQALIDHWPRLRDWLADDRDFLRWHADIDRDVRAWAAGGRDHGALLRGGRLAIAQDWLARRRGHLSQAAVGYILVSSVRARREARVRRAVAGLLAVLILVAGTLSGITVVGNTELAASNDRLRARIDAANAKSLGERSVGLATVDPSTSIQLALAAWRSDPSSPEARTALLRAYLAGAMADRVFPTVSDTRLDRMVLAAGGRTAVVPRGSGYAVVTGLTGDRATTRSLPASSGEAEIAVSPDGRWVASNGDDATVRVWDTRRLGRPRLLRTGTTAPDAGTPDSGTSDSGTPDPGERAGDIAASIRFSPDSKRLLAVVPLASGGSGLRMWTPSSGTPIRHGVPDDATGGLDAGWQTGSADRIITHDRETERLVVRRLSTGEPLRTLPSSASVVLGGRATVTCADRDGAAWLEVRDAADGDVRRTIDIADQECAADGSPPFQLSADGSQLLAPLAEPGPPTLVTTVSLLDGRTYQSVIGTPPARAGRSMSTAATLGFSTPSGGGPPVPIAADDRALVRYRPARPVPTGGLSTQVTADGRWFVADNDDAAVVGRTRDGARVATFDNSDQPVDLYSVPAMSGDALVGEGTVDGATTPRLRVFDPVGKRPRGEFAVAWHAPDRQLPITTGSDRLVVYAGGRVGAWDLDTGRHVGRPFPITENGREPADDPDRGDYRPAPTIRPNHPDQVLLRSPSDAVEVWNLRDGTRLTRLPARVRNVADDSVPPFVADQTGRLAAFVDPEGRVVVWDIDARRRTATLDTSASAVLGFTTTGELAVRVGRATEPQLELWDVRSRRRTGPVEVSAAATPRVTENGLILGDASPFSLSLDPNRWFHRLCTLQDRPFTRNERRLLPGDTATSPPCRRDGDEKTG